MPTILHTFVERKTKRNVAWCFFTTWTAISLSAISFLTVIVHAESTGARTIDNDNSLFETNLNPRESAAIISILTQSTHLFKHLNSHISTSDLVSVINDATSCNAPKSSDIITTRKASTGTETDTALRTNMPDSPALSQVDMSDQAEPRIIDKSDKDDDNIREWKRWLRNTIGSRFGYCSTKISIQENGKISLSLSPYITLTEILVRGAFPIFIERILGRINLTRGMRLPTENLLTNRIDEARGELTTYLKEIGYIDASINVTATVDKRRTARVEFLLNKGTRYRVGNVLTRIVQRPEQTAPKDALLNQGHINKLIREGKVPSQCSPLIHKIKNFYRLLLPGKDYFDKQTIARRVKALEICYQNMGFRAAKATLVRHVSTPHEDQSSSPRHLPSRRNSKINSSQYVSSPNAKSQYGTAYRDVIIDIRPRKHLQIHVIGNTQFSRRELSKGITISQANSYDDYELNRSAAGIEEIYRKRGYTHTKVWYLRHKNQPRWREKITFVIEEQSRLRLRQINISGNQIVDDKTIQQSLVSQKRNAFTGRQGALKRGQIESDRDSISTLYQGQAISGSTTQFDVGYRSELQSPTSGPAVALRSLEHLEQVRNIDRKALALTLHVTEGTQTVFGTTSLKTINLPSSNAFYKTLTETFKLNTPTAGDPYSEKRLEEFRLAILRQLASNGYPYGTVSIDIATVDTPKTTVIDAAVSVLTGQPAIIKDVVVKGNLQTRENVIRSAFRDVIGKPFNIREIEFGSSELQRLGIFSAIRTHVIGTTQKLVQLHIVVDVEESDAGHGEIIIGGGYSTDSKLFTSLAYNWANLWGTAIGFGAKGELGQEIQSGNINLSNPRFLNRSIGLDLQLYGRNQLTKRLGALTTYGGALTFSKQWGKSGLVTSARYGARQVLSQEYITSAIPSFDSFATTRIGSRIANLGISLAYDRRDSPFNPSKGYRIALSGLYASRYIGSQYDFGKIRAYVSGYLPIAGRIILIQSLRYDHGLPVGSSMLPTVERFFAGGDTTIRGYREDGAFYETVEDVQNPGDIRYVPRGSNIRLLSNTELQFPLTPEGLLGNIPINGAIFFDNGSAFNSYAGTTADGFRQSIGVAARVVALVGFLSIEYGIPISRRAGDPNPGRFHFNFGFIF